MAKPGLTTEWIPLRDLEAHMEQWQDLADHAAEANHFYTPDYALAAARYLFPDRDVRALLVWRRTGRAGRQLVGLFPHEIVKRMGFRRWPIFQAWHHDQSSSIAPLIVRGMLDDVVETFLDRLPGSPERPAACLFDEIALDHAVSVRLSGLLEARGRPAVERNAMLRPGIATGSSSAAYLESRLSGRKRGDLRRT